MALTKTHTRIKNEILGKKYSLSLAFISPAKSRAINKKYRGKNKPANVLAFPYAPNEGEILLTKKVIEKDAPKFDMTPREFERFLVIHGMLHLKGYRHGSRMERQEKKYAKKYLSGNRSGVADHAHRRGRIYKRRKIS